MCFKSISLILLTAYSLILTGCGQTPEPPAPAPDDLDPIAANIRALTGGRTRIVWIQDTGEGTDYLARGTDLRLMGLDTDDEHGERVILGGPRNIVKPMFTVDGDRIVFSDRRNNTMHIIPWEGGKPEDLGRGFVLHTWRDPRTGVEWIYYARDFVDDGRTLPTHEAIYRRILPARQLRQRILNTVTSLLRGELKEQLVWDQTVVSEDNYMLSADGRFASAPFPWAQMGVHDTRAKRWNRHGRGCWTAMAPDNSYLLWIFDGPHRNLIMERIGSAEHERWAVRVNELPETDRYEVYHPRWSNHPLIMTVTGPYKIGDGANRLRGGGTDVEVYLGRFAEDHHSIEHWVRATYNNYANFYPDVWVEPDPGVKHHEQARTTDLTAPRSVTWPADRDALVYLWQNGAAQNEIVDTETGRQHIFRPEPRGRARYNHRHAMWPVKGWFVDEDAPLLNAEFSLECMLNMSNISNMPQTMGGGKSLVIGYGPDFGLFAENGKLLFRRHDHTIPLGDIAYNTDTHLTITVSRDKLRFYVNGELKHEGNLPLSETGAPPVTGTLYFGGHPEMTADWQGALSHIALYNRALDDRAPPVNHRLARLETDRYPQPELITVRARVLEQSAIPTPEDIAPYRRGLVVNKYEVTEGPLTGHQFLAAHWAIMDGQILEDAGRAEGTTHTITAELFDNRPELEGERVSMDTEDITLDLYYDLSDVMPLWLWP